jgi:hypothetical protein
LSSSNACNSSNGKQALLKWAFAAANQSILFLLDVSKSPVLYQETGD